MTIAVRDDEIFDIRNYPRDYLYQRRHALQMACKQGYKYIAWNGAIHVSKTDETVFYPPAGFWTPDSLPFIGWKTGYSYSGTSRWLQCDKKVGFAVIPLRKTTHGE